MATNASWRAWFWVEVAIGLVLVVMMRRHFDERLHPRVAEFDFPGTVLSFVGLALVVLGFLQASAFGFVESRQDFHLLGVKLLDKGGIAPTLPMVGARPADAGRVRIRGAPAGRPWKGAARPPLGAGRTSRASGRDRAGVVLPDPGLLAVRRPDVRPDDARLDCLQSGLRDRLGRPRVRRGCPRRLASARRRTGRGQNRSRSPASRRSSRPSVALAFASQSQQWLCPARGAVCA